MKIEIEIPDDIAEYGDHIKNLLGLCVTKLFVNAHKITPDIKEAEDMIDRLKEEVQELEDQLTENRLKGNSLLEIADVVNFALLTYIAIRNEQMKYKGQVDERSRIRAVS
jgi:predicted ribosome quality control (RQC) complex YloA/Tae2 family protein